MSTPRTEFSFAIRDLRQPGWYRVANEVIDQHGPRLGAYGVAVYNVLSRYAKNGTQQVDLSGRDIAAAIRISQDRVRKSLGDLVEIGLIDLVFPARSAPGLVARITLLNAKQELNAARSCNKEEKTNTETETSTLPQDSAGFSPVENKNPNSSNTHVRATQKYTDKDHLEKDIRKIREVQPEIDAIAEQQPSLSSDALDEMICLRVGITLERLYEVRRLQLMRRPERRPG